MSFPYAIRAFLKRKVVRPVTKLFQRFRKSDLDYHLELSRRGDFRIAYRGGTADEKVVDHAFNGSDIFADVPEYEPSPNSIILDIGAHIGTFAIQAAKRVPQGRVFAVEACKETYHYLSINVALNVLDNVDTANVAMSDRSGETTLFYSGSGNWGHSIMQRRGRGGESVRLISLSEFMSSKSIDHFDLAKVNCEGAEFPLLLKTPNNVLSRIGVIFVQYHEDIAPRYRHTQLVDKLQECGFHVEVRQRTRYRGCLIGTMQIARK